MNRLFGFSRNAVALVGIVIALILVVLVGIIIIGSAGIRALMAPDMKAQGISTLALLVAIILLLVACFTMLLVLFRCCCKTGLDKGGELPPDLLGVLIPMLPGLLTLPNVMSDLGVVIYEAGRALNWVEGNIISASDRLSHTLHPLAPIDFTTLDLLGALRQLSTDLKPTDPLHSPTEISENFLTAGKALVKLAQALHATNPTLAVPAELQHP